MAPGRTPLRRRVRPRRRRWRRSNAGLGERSQRVVQKRDVKTENPKGEFKKVRLQSLGWEACPPGMRWVDDGGMNNNGHVVDGTGQMPKESAHASSALPRASHGRGRRGTSIACALSEHRGTPEGEGTALARSTMGACVLVFVRMCSFACMAAVWLVVAVLA